ncbi:MAG: hypothetical protein JW929_09160 [Anaerolineales bacterium]|nr:hypothetical protein [Anaerolineales bacterium]
MNIRRLVITVVFLGLLYMAARPMIDTDTWWHLRTGQWILENRALPQVDRFSFSRDGEPWYYPGWLAEILMAKVHALGGLAGLNLLFGGVLVLAFLVIHLTMEGNPFLRGAVFILAAGASEIYWNARPQLFTFLFTACFYLCLRRYLWGRRNALWVLPLIMVLWVNIHAGFAVGFILLLVAVFGQGLHFLAQGASRPPETGRKLAWLVGTLAACLAAAAVNPHGITILAYPFKTVSIQFLQRFIQEWQSPDFHYLEAQLFLILFFAAWAAVVFSPEKMDVRDFCFLAFIGYMGFLAWRNTNLLSIVAPAVIMKYAQPIVDRLFPGWDPDHAVSKLQSAVHIAAAACLTVAVLFLGAASLSPESIQTAIRRQVPVDAVSYLAENPVQGRMFNSYNFGSYLLWYLPGIPVFVDGRTDLYDDEILSQYLTVIHAREGWREIMEQWRIEVVFVEVTAPIRQVLLSEGWTVLYQDDKAVILVLPGG